MRTRMCAKRLLCRKGGEKRELPHYEGQLQASTPGRELEMPRRRDDRNQTAAPCSAEGAPLGLREGAWEGSCDRKSEGCQREGGRKSRGSGVLDLPLVCCVTVGQLLHPPELQFPFLKYSYKSLCFTRLV